MFKRVQETSRSRAAAEWLQAKKIVQETQKGESGEGVYMRRGFGAAKDNEEKETETDRKSNTQSPTLI